MFRQAPATAAYSPAAASSDSSGFSEQPFTSFNPAFRTTPFDRSLSPQVPHTYHNPTLMASPYSTLPRRPGAATTTAAAAIRGPPALPIMASAVGRHSPLLELTGVSNNRSSSLGRHSSLLHSSGTVNEKDNKKMSSSVRSPLVASTAVDNDDRESCV